MASTIWRSALLSFCPVSFPASLGSFPWGILVLLSLLYIFLL
jgi:hypothetical protein